MKVNSLDGISSIAISELLKMRIQLFIANDGDSPQMFHNAVVK